jgi:hypothetical protein
VGALNKEKPEALTKKERVRATLRKVKVKSSYNKPRRLKGGVDI